MSRLQQGLSKLNSVSNMGSRSPTTGAVGIRVALRQRRQELRRAQAANPCQARRTARFLAVKDLNSDALRRDIRRVIEHLCDTENPLLNRMEREKLIEGESSRDARLRPVGAAP